jgi:hypothetical protein
LDIVYTSEHTAGYITQPGYSEHLRYPIGLMMFHTIKVLPGQILMLSVAEFATYNRIAGTFAESKLDYSCLFDDYLQVNDILSNGVEKRRWTLCGDQFTGPTIFNGSIVLRFKSPWVGPHIIRAYATGFELRFSLHPSSESITQLPNGLFNCSQHYTAFRQHLECNVRLECESGEDETEACPYTSHQCPPESLFYQVTTLV